MDSTKASDEDERSFNELEGIDFSNLADFTNGAVNSYDPMACNDLTNSNSPLDPNDFAEYSDYILAVLCRTDLCSVPAIKNVMFLNRKGWSMHFVLQFDDSILCEQIAKKIEDHEGLVTTKIEEVRPHSAILVDNDMIRIPGYDTFKMSYIDDCIEEGKVRDISPYLSRKSEYFTDDLDYMKIVHDFTYSWENVPEEFKLKHETCEYLTAATDSDSAASDVSSNGNSASFSSVDSDDESPAVSSDEDSKDERIDSSHVDSNDKLNTISANSGSDNEPIATPHVNSDDESNAVSSHNNSNDDLIFPSHDSNDKPTAVSSKIDSNVELIASSHTDSNNKPIALSYADSNGECTSQVNVNPSYEATAQFHACPNDEPIVSSHIDRNAKSTAACHVNSNQESTAQSHVNSNDESAAQLLVGCKNEPTASAYVTAPCHVDSNQKSTAQSPVNSNSESTAQPPVGFNDKSTASANAVTAPCHVNRKAKRIAPSYVESDDDRSVNSSVSSDSDEDTDSDLGVRKLNSQTVDKNTRAAYSMKEKKAILDYIVNHNRFADVKGVMLWRDMEQEKICPQRTWQSMKEHYRKCIVNQLSQFDYISREDKNKLRSAFRH